MWVEGGPWEGKTSTIEEISSNVQRRARRTPSLRPGSQCRDEGPLTPFLEGPYGKQGLNLCDPVQGEAS